MNMMKKTIILVLLIVCAGGVSAKSVDLEKVESKVKEYYESIKMISKNPTSDEAVNVGNCLDIFFEIDKNGNHTAQSYKWANDFAYLGLTDNAAPISPYDYINKYTRYCERGEIMAFSYDIKSIKLNENPKALPEDKSPVYATAIVKKSYSVKRKSKSVVMYDTLYIMLSELKLGAITNESYTKFDLWLSSPIVQRLAKANGLYNQRKFELAGKLYESVLKEVPTQEEASYNLAVMYLYGKYGRKQYSRKERLAKAESLFKLSYKGLKVLDYYSSGKNPDIYKG